MELHEAIRKRRSVRFFEDHPVDDAALVRVLEAARLAPSADNRQEWRYVVVRDAERRSAVAVAAHGQGFIARAGAILVCCTGVAGPAMGSGVDSTLMDLTISMDYLTLAAVAENLGTCWIGAFNAFEVRRICSIPDTVGVGMLIALGHPRDLSERTKSRVDLDAILFDNQYGVAWKKSGAREE